MLHCRITTAFGRANLTSTSPSLHRGVRGFSTPPRLAIQTRSVTYNYRPFTLKEYNAPAIAASMEKRQNIPSWKGGAKRKKEQQDRRQMTDGSPEQVLDIEARSLLEKLRVENGDAEAHNGESIPEPKTPSSRPERPEPHTELELEIQELSSTGDGLAYTPARSSDFIYVVPFAVPGDKVLAKTYPQNSDSAHPWTKVDFVRLLSRSLQRKGVTPQCQYFGTCSGCQFQMLPYQAQLVHKKTIVEKAFRYFSNLDPSLVPAVDETIGSPVQYGYRTKLTPHYDGCSRARPWREGDKSPAFGFAKKNTTKVLDIEQCPIGTEILNEGLKVERENLADTFWRKKTGSTVLLRESTRRELLPPEKQSPSKEAATNGVSSPTAPQTLSVLPLEYSGLPESTNLSYPSPSSPQIKYTYPTFQDLKTYTSDNKAFTTEHVGPFTFTTRANSFFQNNNSILPTFLSYIREHFLPSNKNPAISADGETYSPKIKYLLDAYCGSGLFSIALASEFSSVLGIDIDALSIECARENAKINHTTSVTGGESNLGFIAADALAIFEDVPFPASQTLCIIDPPRKGASRDFLQQLCVYGPKRVVYVSCNVHTQARDVGMLVHGFNGESGRGGGWRYEIERVGGFDFFPQTGHVEGVCFLNRVEEGA